MADGRRRGVRAVLTNDAKQMQRSHEVEAIARAGIHRIQYPHKHAGLTGTGIAIATVCAALPGVLSLLAHATAQHLVVLTGIDPSPGSRYKLCVPSETRPNSDPLAERLHQVHHSRAPHRRGRRPDGGRRRVFGQAKGPRPLGEEGL